ncbi:molybdate ABC transporter substrate-binding protein [Leeuwenhoekiella marinoflava]|uniref:molybdate ABC transporter substrate-binding protein n=1 Tax=Leeuwenhoekiella marinoflava TaxID=988 RepID=UPI003AB93FB6
MLLRCLKFLLVVLFIFCSACAKRSNKNTITIATAANMQFAMQELADRFSSQTDIACEFVIASSGKLTAQIKEGAPYDVFVAANTKYPQAIYDAGFSYDIPKIYAYGKLVIWSLDEKLQLSFETLSNLQVKHIALANPKTAPYGLAAVNALQRKELYEHLEEKLVYGESISQTNQFIISGAAEIGFTALSVVKASEVQTKGNWILVDDSLYSPIEQAAVLIKRGEQVNEAAKAFYEYIFSEEAQEILLEFGYSVNE